MNKDIDIIIYGATGFTGQLCVKYFQSLETKVSWAIAGRNLEKLKKVAQENQTNVESVNLCFGHGEHGPVSRDPIRSVHR